MCSIIVGSAKPFRCISPRWHQNVYPLHEDWQEQKEADTADDEGRYAIILPFGETPFSRNGHSHIQSCYLRRAFLEAVATFERLTDLVLDFFVGFRFLRLPPC